MALESMECDTYQETLPSDTIVLSDVRSLVAELNDMAIEKLQSSKSDEACGLLVDALHVLETSHHLYYEQAPSTILAPLTPELQRGVPSVCCGVDCLHHSRRHLNVRLPDHDVQSNLPTAIYNRAFLIDNKGPRNAHLDTAVLAFNIGLSYHLLGVGRGVSHALNRALVWYDHAHRIVLEESRVWENRSQSRLIVLLAAALCHNTAAIHGDDFWDFGRARLLRCQLAQVIHWEGSRFSQMETDDFVFFHLGIFFAIIDDFRVAPAA